MLDKTFQQRFKEALDGDTRPVKIIAYDSGFHSSHIYRVACGRYKGSVSLFFVETMAKTLDKPIAWLLGIEK